MSKISRTITRLTIMGGLLISQMPRPVASAIDAVIRPTPLLPLRAPSISLPAPRAPSAAHYWADVNGDGRVDGVDLTLASERWACRAGDACYEATFDRNADGRIDALDLAYFGNEYDVSGPDITITAPLAGQVIGGGALGVTGHVGDRHPVLTVTVNGRAAALTGDTFNATIPMSGGNQLLLMVAEDEVGQSSAATQLVSVDQDGPMVEVSAPRHRQSVYGARPAIALGYADFYTNVVAGTLRVTLTDQNGLAVDVTGNLTIGPNEASGAPGYDLAQDMTYTLTATVDDSLGNPGAAQATFYVPVNPGSLVPPVEGAEAGWVSGVVYDSSTCDAYQTTCQGVSGARVSLVYLETTTSTRPVSGTIVTGPDGFFAFPVSATGQYQMRVVKAGYTYGQRQVEIVKQRSTAVNAVYVTPIDAAVTLCDAAGCNHTSADGQVQVVIPAGAILAGRQISVTATEFDRVNYLPSGELPPGTWETYAFNLGGESDESFAKPVTVSVKNSRGFAPGSDIPLGYWNPELFQWEHAGVAVVDATGEWVVMQVTHFSNFDPNYPVATSPSEVLLDDLTQKCQACMLSDEAGSQAAVRSGVLQQIVQLPSVPAAHARFAPALVYDSGQADASELIEVELGLKPAPGIELGKYVQAELFIEGEKTANFTFATDTLAEDGEIGRFRYWWDGRNAQGQRLQPGIYRYAVHARIPYRAQYYRAINNRFGASPDYTRPTGRYTTATQDQWVYGSAIVSADPESPFGRGWNLAGQQRLRQDESGRILIDDGNYGLTEYYFPGQDLAQTAARATQRPPTADAGPVAPSLQPVPQDAAQQPAAQQPAAPDRPTQPVEAVEAEVRSRVADREPEIENAQPAAPDINASGTITVDTVWTKANSPYVLTDWVVVSATVMLTIEPGVEVRAGGDRRIIVHGRLEAIGTAADPITFTSVANTGPGQWGGLSFEGGSGELANTTVRYAGADNDRKAISVSDSPDGVTLRDSRVISNCGQYASFGVWASNSQLMVSNSEFAYNGGSGWTDYALYTTGASTLTVSGTVFHDNKGGYGLYGGGVVTVAGSVFANNDGYGLRLEMDDWPRAENLSFVNDEAAIGAGTATVDGVLATAWGARYYWLQDWVTVGQGATLTIEPGVEVRADGDRRMIVRGRLEAIGTAANPITFTSVANTGPGQWAGVYFEGGSGELANTTVRYAGAGSDRKAISVSDSPDGVTLRDSRVISNSGKDRDSYGVWASNSQLMVSNSEFAYNGGSGWTDYALYTTGASTLTVSGTVFHDNKGGYGLYGGGVVTVVGSVFANNDGYGLRLEMDDWPRAENLSFVNDEAAIGAGTATVDGVLATAWGARYYWLQDWVTVGQGATLTIEPGVEVRADGDRRMIVRGRLEAIGTAANPITFTSVANTGPGQWAGMYFEGGSGELVNTTVRYAGTGSDRKAISVSDSPDGVMLRDSRVISNYGQYASYGVWASNSRLVVSNTVFAGNGGSGWADHALYATGDCTVTVEQTTFQQNSSYAARLPLASLNSFKDNQFIDNGYDRIIFQGGGALTSHARLTRQRGMAGYEFMDDVTVAPGVVLTVDEGVATYWAEGRGLTVHGRLVAVGAEERPITFTQSADNGSRTWAGITFGDGQGNLALVTVRYAVNGLRVHNGDVTLRYATIVSNSQNGVAITGNGARFFVAGSSFANNGGGYYGLRNDSGGLVDARYNWWGHASGPYHPAQNPAGQGNRVSDNVLFDPWLESEPCAQNVYNRTAWDTSTLTYHRASNTYTRHYADGSMVHFNADGTHDYTQDAAGNMTAYAYTADGALARIEIYPSGVVTSAWTWTFSRITAAASPFDKLAADSPSSILIADPAGYVTTLKVDGRGDLVSVQRPGGDMAMTFAYDAGHHMTHQQDESGNLTGYVYDATGRLKQTELPVRQVYDSSTGTVEIKRESHGYTPSDTAYQVVNDMAPGTPATPTGALVASQALVDKVAYAGYQESYHTDAWGFALDRTDGLSQTTGYERDAAGRVTREVSPSGVCTEYTRDAWGSVTRRQKVPADQCGLAPEQRDASRIQTWSYAYAARFHDLATSEIDPLNQETTYVYDASGNLLTETLPAVMTLGGLVSPTTVYQYDASGNRTRVTNPLGSATCYTYTRGTQDERAGGSHPLFAMGVTPVPGLLTQEARDCAGQAQVTTHRDFDAAGNPQIVEAAGGFVPARLRYDPFGRVVSETNAVSITVLYEYDVSGNLVRRIEDYTADGSGRNVATEYTYDGQGNLLLERTVVEGLAVERAYGYDANHRRVMERDALANTTWRTYDALGRVVRTAMPGGQVLTYTYTADGGLSGESDGEGRLTRYGYDDLGRNIRVVQDDGGLNLTMTNTLDLLDRVVETQDADGAVVRYETNSLGGLTAEITVLAGQMLTRTHTYDAAGNRVRSVDERGLVTERAYDALNHLVRETQDPGGLNLTTVYTYSAGGMPSALRNARGAVTTFEYDALNRLIWQVDDADGLALSTSFTYDRLGNLEETRLPDGSAQRAEHNAFGKPVREIEDVGRLGYVTTSEYDAGLNLRRQTTANGYTHGYTYTSDGQVASQQDPDGRTTATLYDGRGLPVQRNLADGQSVVYGYNGAGWVTQRAYSDGITDTFGYDKAGRIASALRVDGQHVVLQAYVYDELGNVVSNTQTVDGRAFTTRYAYDYAAGAMTLTYPSSTTVVVSMDAAGRLSRVTQDGAHLAAWTYTDTAGLESVTYANGIAVTTQRDALDRITRVSSSLSDYRYGYDGAGRVTWMQRVHQSGAPYDVYAYDGSGQLTRAWYGANNPALAAITSFRRSVIYKLDGLRNRINVSDSLSGTTAYGPNDGIRSSDPMNRYQQADGSTLMYDGRGNLTRDGTYTYTYNAGDEWIGAAGGGHVTAYVYDALGNRVARVADGQTTYIVHAASGHILEERTDAGLTARYVAGQGLDELVSMQRAGQRAYYQQDALGSVTDLSDEAGALIERYEFDVYGATTIYNATGRVITATAVGNVFGFTGRPYDPLFGVYDYRARAYHPALGRFMQMDPLGAPDGLNRYAYVDNAPSSWTDPLGLEKCEDKCRAIREKLRYYRDNGQVLRRAMFKRYASPQSWWQKLGRLVDRYTEHASLGALDTVEEGSGFRSYRSLQLTQQEQTAILDIVAVKPGGHQNNRIVRQNMREYGAQRALKTAFGVEYAREFQRIYDALNDDWWRRSDYIYFSDYLAVKLGLVPPNDCYEKSVR